MAPPEGQDAAAPAPSIPRAAASYVCRDDRFLLKARDYDRQYAQLYFYRLTQMRPAAQAAAEARWPGLRMARVLELSEEEEVAVVGTLYKDMKLKPSILDEYVKDRALQSQLGHAQFVQADDRLILEDDGARVTLAGVALPPGECVTGVIAAVRGRVLPSGELEVSDACFCGVPPQRPRPPPAGGDKYIAIVSGLALGDPAGRGGEGGGALRLQLLVDYLGGLLGGEQEHATVARIARIVIAGGLLEVGATLSQPTAYAGVRQQSRAVSAVRDADMLLTELAAALPVDIMPGAGDPANYSLPQQPLHRCLLPGAGAFSSLNRVTNPHEFEADGVRFLGTSGQNVDDVWRYSEMESAADVMERMLTWRHLVPTAPDTLAVSFSFSFKKG
jgi:DNA polymerase delta subunit 2